MRLVIRGGLMGVSWATPHIAAAKARGKRLGRQPGQRPKSDRLAPKVLALIAQGRSYRLVGREVELAAPAPLPPLTQLGGDQGAGGSWATGEAMARGAP